MAFLTRLLWRFLYICALFFVLISVVYTTEVLFLFSVATARHFGTFSKTDSSSLDTTESIAGIKRAISQHQEQGGSVASRENLVNISHPALSFITQRGLASTAPTFGWISSEFTLKHGLGYPGSKMVDGRTVLSKAFANSMRPSNVLPYFYRASGSFKRDDITITTLVTSNRFEVLARLVKKYKGPISVTVHIKDIKPHVNAVLNSLHDMYTSSEFMMTFADVHLVVDTYDRQFNNWRNIARLFARTDYVMMLDIDFYPCTDFRRLIREGLNSTMLQKLDASRAALVIPAFEYRNFHQGIRSTEFPTNKMGLLSLVRQRQIGMFHASWAAGHNSTNYEKFYAAPPGFIYRVVQYQAAYEPYVILKKEGPPWCDERFVGYGGNKAACLFEMYLSGISYFVLGDHFIIHQNHLYEETTRKAEKRKYNKKVYAEFKQEACIRYMKRYHDAGVIGTDLALNALTECKRMKPYTNRPSRVGAS